MDCEHAWKDLIVSSNMDHPIQLCRRCERFRFSSPRDGWIEEIGDKTIDAYELVRMFNRRILHFHFGDCGQEMDAINEEIKNGRINNLVLSYFKDNVHKCMWHLSFLMRSIPISEGGSLFIYGKKECSKTKE